MLPRRRLLALAGGLPLLAAIGCGPPPVGSALQRARDAGAIRVGISGEQPYGYSDSQGRVTGAQPEVARVVLGRLGVTVIEAVQVRFDRLIPGLLDAQYDLITAGMTVAPDRCARVAFSRPDFLALPAFLVPEGNPTGIATFGGVARSGQRLAVLSGSAELTYARAAGVPEDRLHIVDNTDTLFRHVADGLAQVGALTEISLAGELRRNPWSGLEVTEGVSPVVDGDRVVPAGAFATRPGETALLTAFDAELTALHRSGEWLRITAPFGFTADNLPPPDLTTAELCAP